MTSKDGYKRDKMESLARAIIQGYENHFMVLAEKAGAFEFQLPIKTICGINVAAEIGIRKAMSGPWRGGVDMFVFRIFAYEVGYEEAENAGALYVIYSKLFPKTQAKLQADQVEAYLEEILEIIPTLRFDKKTTKLTADYVYDDEAVALFKFDNTTTKYEECCVCHELCGTKTECEHSLCLMCISSMPRVYDEEEDEEIKKCPMCREKIENVKV